MDISVIIPTFQRAEKLAACLRSLATQSLPSNTFEVLVGFDGDDPAAHQLARETWDAIPTAHPSALSLHALPRTGYTRVRNALLRHAQGRILVSTNDDVVLSPNFLAAHLAAHNELRAIGKHAVISGDSRWRIHPNDTAWDRLIRESPMIFFDRVMRSEKPDPDKDWGFRHSWGLNISAETARIREVGGFTVFPAWYGYEDTEIAFKLNARFPHTPVLYRPQASLEHNHRVAPDEYLRRECTLGFAALGFAQCSPDCAAAMFSRDITSTEERDYCSAFVRRERTAAARAWNALHPLNTQPADSISDHTIDAEYRAHLPLKRWAWRTGLLDAFADKPLDAGSILTRLAP